MKKTCYLLRIQAYRLRTQAYHFRIAWHQITANTFVGSGWQIFSNFVGVGGSFDSTCVKCALWTCCASNVCVGFFLIMSLCYRICVPCSEVWLWAACNWRVPMPWIRDQCGFRSILKQSTRPSCSKRSLLHLLAGADHSLLLAQLSSWRIKLLTTLLYTHTLRAKMELLVR